jgi:hypothetical protein
VTVLILNPMINGNKINLKADEKYTVSISAELTFSIPILVNGTK